MGNSFPKYKWITVGTNAGIKFEREDIVKSEEYCPHVVSYYVNGKVVRLTLKIKYDFYSRNFEKEEKYGKSYWKNKLHICGLRFKFKKEPYGSKFSFFIGKDKNNLLRVLGTKYINAYYELEFSKEIKNHWGGVTKTNVYYRGVENEGNLLVVEQKRKKGDEQPCAITVTHYYAFSRQRFISQKKYEVGLSIVVDIRVLDDDLDVSMKGPIEHPTLALLQMFQQVSRTWSWKWTACSHCAAQIHMQQSETENDDEEMKNLLSSREIGGIILANQGVINGNNNGNLVVKNLFLRGPS